MSGIGDAERREAQKRIVAKLEDDLSALCDIGDDARIRKCDDMPGEDEFVRTLNELIESHPNQFPPFDDGYRKDLYADSEEERVLLEEYDEVPREIELDKRHQRRETLRSRYKQLQEKHEMQSEAQKKKQKMDKLAGYSSSSGSESSAQYHSSYSDDEIDEPDTVRSPVRVTRKKDVKALLPGELDEARMKPSDLTFGSTIPNDFVGALVKFKDGEKTNIGYVVRIGDANPYEFRGESCSEVLVVEHFEDGRETKVRLNSIAKSAFSNEEMELIRDKLGDSRIDSTSVRASIKKLKTWREKASRDGKYRAALVSNMKNFVAEVKREEMEALRKQEAHLETEEDKELYEEIKKRVEKLDDRLKVLTRKSAPPEPVARPQVSNEQERQTHKLLEMRKQANSQQPQEKRHEEQSIDSKTMQDIISKCMRSSSDEEAEEEDDMDI